MKSFDFEAVTFDGACYCTSCLPNGITEDHDEVSPIFADRAIREALSQHEAGEFDGLVVSDMSEVPEDYEGEVLHINERGNSELYLVRYGKTESLGSQV